VTDLKTVFHFSFFISVIKHFSFLISIPLQFEKGTEKYAKKIIDVQLRAQFLQDIKAISCAWSPVAAVRLKSLFFEKWEGNVSPIVLDVTAHFKREWCNERLGNWTRGHAHNCVINTNGLEATNKVIKDELTYRQLMPVMDFLQRSLLWVKEQSERRSDGPDDLPNPNKITFALEHTRTTNDWTSANSWVNNTSKQIRFLPLHNAYVATAPGVRGDLTDARANVYFIAFQECDWDTYDQYTSMSHNVSILHHDVTRPEQYKCTCSANAKQFTCIHSLGVAMMRGTLVAPHAAQIQLLGRKRRRGRKPMAAPAWEMMPFALDTPPQHPQQDAAILLGNPVADGDNLAADLAVE
jgi:hypothetical protein